MAVTFIASDLGATEPGTTVAAGGTLTMVDGDGLIALIHMNNDDITVTGLDGFTQFGATNWGSGGSSLAALSKTAASDSGDFTFTISASNRVTVILIQLRGASDLELDVGLTTDGVETSSNTTEGPDILTAVNSMAIAWHLEDTNLGAAITSVDNSYAWPDAGDVDTQAQDFAYRAFDSGGQTGETKLTGGTRTHIGYCFSFKESAASTSALVFANYYSSYTGGLS